VVDVLYEPGLQSQIHRDLYGDCQVGALESRINRQYCSNIYVDEVVAGLAVNNNSFTDTVNLSEISHGTAPSKFSNCESNSYPICCTVAHK